MFLDIVQKNGMNLQYVEKDKDIVLAAVHQNGMALQFAGEWNDDIEVVLAACDNTPEAFRFASVRLKDDKELVLHVTKYIAFPLAFASLRLRDDPDVVLSTMGKLFSSLDYASDALKDNKLFILKCVQINGRYLKYASPHMRADKEVVLAAISSQADAFMYASNDLRSDPELIRMISHNPEAIRYALPPLKRTRSYSQSSTDQDTEGVCGYHAFSKVILKNVLEWLYPLHVSKRYTKENCNKYLTTTTTQQTLGYLTPQECSMGGYLKILLFLHLFYSYKQFVTTVTGRPTGWLECVQVNVIYPHLFQASTIPGMHEIQAAELKDTLLQMKHIYDIMNIHLITFHFTPTLEWIQKITEKGLYLMLRIEDSKSLRQHAAHFVVVVGTQGEEILFKNSWKDDHIFRCILGIPFALGPYIYGTTTDCVCVFPVEGGEDKNIRDMSLFDKYFKKYRPLR
jgi:hypothetical protein